MVRESTSSLPQLQITLSILFCSSQRAVRSWDPKKQLSCYVSGLFSPFNLLSGIVFPWDYKEILFWCKSGITHVYLMRSWAGTVIEWHIDAIKYSKILLFHVWSLWEKKKKKQKTSWMASQRHVNDKFSQFIYMHLPMDVIWCSLLTKWIQLLFFESSNKLINNAFIIFRSIH